MNITRYLIIHRDHVFDPNGVNSGAEMATLFLCRFLAKQGHKVVLAGQFPENVPASGNIEYWNLGKNFDVQGIIRKARELGTYHLISAGRAIPVLISQSESACLSRSLISHDRSSNDTGLDAKVLSGIVDNIFCVSEAQKEFFIKDGVSPEKLTVIHNGVDLDLFKASDYTKRSHRKLIFAGALVVDKGLHVLLESYSRLKQKYSDLTLDVYGSSDLWRRNEYINPSEVEKTLPGVKFHGKVSQDILSKAMQTAGICVIPSIWFDPFPLVSIDAQATGCPVVAFDVGGLKEGIQHGITGLVVSEVSTEKLTENLDQLLSDSQKWQAMSDNALKLSRQKFTWEKLINTIVSKTQNKNLIQKVKTPKTALFSTWNQQCGLATYGKYLFTEFEPSDYIVLAEETTDTLTGTDEPNVFRCWKKEQTNFEKIKSLISANKVEVLFFNFHTHYRLFPQPDFNKFISEVQQTGVKVVAHLHNTYTLDPALGKFLSVVDEVMTLSPENRLEAIANGAPAEKTSFLPHGVFTPKFEGDKSALRKKLGISEDQKAVTCFGFIQAHKGIEDLIQSVAVLRGKNINIHGYILGSLNSSDPNGENYMAYLKKMARNFNVSEYIHFAERFLSNQEVSEYLAASDLVLMNYKSLHYEASGACSLAVGAGALVAASLAPAFIPFKDSVWHLSAGFSPALSIELLLADQKLAHEIKARAEVYCKKYSWNNIAKLLSVKFIDLCTALQKQAVSKPSVVEVKESRRLKVLMQNRNNTFTQRGGDTILMEKTIDGLRKRGVQVTVDLEDREDAANYDIVHLFNFVLSDMVKYFGEKAQRAGVPFVVTTLHEEIAKFHNPSVLVAHSLIQYVKSGQSRQWYEQNRIDLKNVEACLNFDNTWAAKNASALIANGSEEAKGLISTYPGIKNVHVVPVGYDIGAEGNAEDFYREYGVRDFVFCVGRLESRKNQLMLLKALEDSEIPVVLAGGGFTYQPDYAQAVKNFRRKGKTIVLDKLSPHMLASAYRAAKVHALPSWYELPGLVSLEAAYYGCNVVVTDYGTARSYFGDQAFYCEPGSEQSILQTVSAAYDMPQKTGLKEVSMKYTWDNASEKTLETYNKVLGREADAAGEIIKQGANMQQQNNNIQIFDLDSDATRFQEMLERGELAAKEKDLARAEKYLTEAEFINPGSARLLRAKGAVKLASGDVLAAKDYFERGIRVDSGNAKLYSGLGMCEMQLKNNEKAHDLFMKALEIAPFELVAILQLLECSYVLNKYGDLEKVLRRYLLDHPADMQMQYCLAGCLYKQSRIEESKSIIDRILSAEPENLGAKQLKSAIDELRTTEPVKAFTLKTEIKEVVFDSSDQEISEIEELKRVRNYKEVLSRSEARLQNANLRTDQKEKLELLQSEAEVLLGNVEKADACFDKILSQNPLSARAMCGKGAIAASRGDWNSAKAYFEKANSLEPDYDVAWAGLGVYSLSINDKSTAWECFSKAITINPENIRALLGMIELGYSLRKLDDVEKVIKLYLEMHPLDLNFLYSLAGCYFAQDKLSEAQAEVDKICMFEPDNKHAIELRDLINQKQQGGKLAGVNA